LFRVAVDGWLQVDALRARGMRADRRLEPLANTREDHLAACGPGLDLGGHFAFTLSWNEFIYALTFVSSSEVKTVPVGVVTELVEGDVYHGGALMAGAPAGALPVAIMYSFLVTHYVYGLTAAAKRSETRARNDLFRIGPATGDAAGSFALPVGACTHSGGLAYLGNGQLLLADTRQLFRIDLARALASGKAEGAMKAVKIAGELRGSYATFDGKDA